MCEKLGAPFHTVITAEEVSAYKPLMKALNICSTCSAAAPKTSVTCSSSFRYDLMIGL